MARHEVTAYPPCMPTATHAEVRALAERYAHWSRDAGWSVERAQAQIFKYWTVFGREGLVEMNTTDILARSAALALVTAAQRSGWPIDQTLAEVRACW